MKLSEQIIWVLAAISAGCISGPALANGGSDKSSEEWSGRCFYAERYKPLLSQGHVFADCNTLRVAQSGGQRVFAFSYAGRTRGFEFKTERDGSEYIVSAIRLPNGGWLKARGECSIALRGGSVSAVTCIATQGGTTYAANFEPSD